MNPVQTLHPYFHRILSKQEIVAYLKAASHVICCYTISVTDTDIAKPNSGFLSTIAENQGK
jgi:hypothetical protein